MKKKPIVDKLLGTTHLEADIALLRTKNPQHTLLQHPHFNALQADTDALMALLDMATEEEIVLNRRQLVADASTEGQAAAELAEKEAADKAAAELAEKEAADEAATGLAEKEVAELAEKEAADKAAAELVEKETADKAAAAAKAAAQKKSSKKKKSTPK